MVGENIARANHAIRALGDLYEAHRTAEKSAEELIRFALEEMKEAVLLMGQRERLIDVVNEKAAVYATDIQVTSVAEGERTTY